jgi:hypothetical protein
MRCVASAGLLVLVGCNQIFGLAPTQPYDAGPDGVLDMPHVVLDWQIAALLSTGAPDPTIQFAAIVPAPRIRIALLDAPFDRDQATYSISDGWIPIPRAYLNTTWRLEYTLAGEVPHEVQWAPDDKQGHLTVPVFGRVKRDPAPGGGGYKITPPNPPGSYTFPRVFTTGLWTEGKVTAAPVGATLDYNFSNAVSLNGANGHPEAALGDQAIAVDYMVNAGCRISVGSAAFDPTLQSGTHTMLTPPWNTTTGAVMSAPVDFGFIDRLTTGLGKLESMFSGPLSVQLFGAAASTGMPGLAGTPESAALLGVQLPVPVMHTLLQCPYMMNPLPSATQPPALDPFPRVLHVQLVDSRQVLGVTLSSGMETVIVSAAGGGFTMAFPAPIATQIKLATPGKGLIDLADNSDQIAVGPASGPFDLSFVPEAAVDLRADYFDVVLHRIAGGTLTTERIYTVTAPKVRIDGSVLVPGADYVFEIRSYKGHPKAQHGDFSAVDYPYGAAIVFTRTFKAS